MIIKITFEHSEFGANPKPKIEMAIASVFKEWIKHTDRVGHRVLGIWDHKPQKGIDRVAGQQDCCRVGEQRRQPQRQR